MTKSTKNQQNDKKTKLTDKQLRVIPLIVTSPTYTEACKKARINRATLYGWLKVPAFREELEQQRSEIVADAFGILSQNLTKAVEVLASLLNNKDKRLKRLAAKDVIEYVIKHRENEEIMKRIDALEQEVGVRK